MPLNPSRLARLGLLVAAVVAIVAVGVPASPPRGTGRQPLDEILRFVPGDPVAGEP